MADLYTRVETVSNAGATLATYGVNALKNSNSTSDAGRTFIVSVARTNENGGLTNDVLNSVIGYITTSHGVSGSGDSAFTVAGTGTADGAAFVNTAAAIAADTAQEIVYLRIQGTGDLTVGTADMGIANVTVALVAVFAPAK
jgi:hypothetical protein